MSCNCSALRGQNQPPQSVFRLGQIVATRGVLAHVEHHGIATDPFLRQPVTGDWGDVLPEDAKSNWLAVRHGLRILSSFKAKGQRIWVITEADRSVTTLLFPSEY